MRVSSRLFRSGLGILVVAFAASATAEAQKPTPKVRPAMAPPKPGAKPTVAAKAAKPPESRVPGGFTGIASKLNTTPAALETAFDAARAADPKLTHGQFIAANVLAQNLSGKNPAITTQAILDGLKSGKSIGQTLQSLGLSAKDVDAAEDAAQKEIKAAEKAAKEAAEEAKEKKPDKDDLKKPEPKKPEAKKPAF